jgi:ferredoxin
VTYRVVFHLPDGSQPSVPVQAGEHVLDAGLAAGIDLPYRCLQGWCLTCAARIVEGRLDQRDSRRYYPADRAEGFALICTATPLSDCVLETHARDAMRRARDRHGLPYPRGDWGGGA